MKTTIHPTTYLATYACNSCGTSFHSLSTVEGPVRVEVCSNCHPQYTGQAGVVIDTFSRVDRFKRHEETAAQSNVQQSKDKKLARRKKVSEVKAGPGLTLRDMLKQVK